jgi:hypothetical protein
VREVEKVRKNRGANNFSFFITLSNTTERTYSAIFYFVPMYLNSWNMNELNFIKKELLTITSTFFSVDLGKFYIVSRFFHTFFVFAFFEPLLNSLTNAFELPLLLLMLPLTQLNSPLLSAHHQLNKCVKNFFFCSRKCIQSLCNTNKISRKKDEEKNNKESGAEEKKEEHFSKRSERATTRAVAMEEENK